MNTLIQKVNDQTIAIIIETAMEIVNNDLIYSRRKDGEEIPLRLVRLLCDC